MKSPIVDSQPEPKVALYEQKNSLRDRHKKLVSQLTRQNRLEHWEVNSALKDQTGTGIDNATLTQLKHRIRLLERWVENGFGKRRGRRP